MIGREGVKYLGEFDFVFELMESIVEAAEGINVLLVLPRHLHLRSTALPLHIIIHTQTIVIHHSNWESENFNLKIWEFLYLLLHFRSFLSTIEKLFFFLYFGCGDSQNWQGQPQSERRM